MPRMIGTIGTTREAVEAKIKSLNERLAAIEDAVRREYNRPANDLEPAAYAWAVATYDDRVIVKKGDSYHQVPYKVTDGEIELLTDEATEVERDERWNPVEAFEDESLAAGKASEGNQVVRTRARVLGPRLQEGADAGTFDGSQWDMVIIQEGLSKNRNRYQRKCLTEAAPLYDGARIYVDHEEAPRRFGRSTRDLAGFIRDPEVALFKEAENADAKIALTATACITLGWLREGMLAAWKMGRPDLYGFSHDVEAKSEALMLPDGPAYDVTTIRSVASVDVVTNPAAGGRLTRLVASDTAPASLEEDGRMLQQMIEAIKKHRPDLAARLGDTPDESTVMALFKEAVAHPVPPAQVAAPPAPAPAQTTQPALPAGMTMISEATLADINAKLQEGSRHIASLNLERNLAECSLPDPLKARIRKRFTERIKAGQVPTDDEIVQAIAESVEDYGALAEAKIVLPHVAGTAQVTKDRRDKLVEALDAFFDPKKPATSIRNLYVDITGDARVTGKVKEATRLTESLNTASFDQILGDSIARRMLKEYADSGLANWRGTVAEVVPVSDFRTQRRLRFGGYPNLPVVGQGAPYLGLVSPTDEEATWTPSKRGGTESLTLEMIKNDDVGAVRRIPNRLGRAAAMTLHEFVWDMLGTNAVIYDTVALAAAGHGNNIVLTALSATNISALRLRMKQQTDMSSGKRLGLSPRYLIVPSELEELAFQLTTSDKVLPDANLSTTAAPAAPSFIRKMNLTPIVVEYWTDNNNYWLAASVDQTPMIEVGFMDGQEDPELFVQDMPTVGSMFSNDQLTYKLRHIYGGGVMDYRGFAAGIVA